MARRSKNKNSSQNPNSNSAKAKNQHKQNGSKSAVVEIYTASFCPHCQDAKMYMNMNKIKYTEYNLDKMQGVEKKFLALGGKKIPLLVVKGQVLRSWNQASFEKVYKS